MVRLSDLINTQINARISKGVSGLSIVIAGDHRPQAQRAWRVGDAAKIPVLFASRSPTGDAHPRPVPRSGIVTAVYADQRAEALLQVQVAGYPDPITVRARDADVAPPFAMGYLTVYHTTITDPRHAFDLLRVLDTRLTLGVDAGLGGAEHDYHDRDLLATALATFTNTLPHDLLARIRAAATPALEARLKHTASPVRLVAPETTQPPLSPGRDPSGPAASPRAGTQKRGSTRSWRRR